MGMSSHTVLCSAHCLNGNSIIMLPCMLVARGVEIAAFESSVGRRQPL